MHGFTCILVVLFTPTVLTQYTFIPMCHPAQCEYMHRSTNRWQLLECCEINMEITSPRPVIFGQALNPTAFLKFPIQHGVFQYNNSAVWSGGRRNETIIVNGTVVAENAPTSYSQAVTSSWSGPIYDRQQTWIFTMTIKHLQETDYKTVRIRNESIQS